MPAHPPRRVQEDNTGAGLLLEQAAHSLLRLQPPRARKFAFHLVLAGLRYGACDQDGLAQRCYRWPGVWMGWEGGALRGWPGKAPEREPVLCRAAARGRAGLRCAAAGPRGGAPDMAVFVPGQATCRWCRMMGAAWMRGITSSHPSNFRPAAVDKCWRCTEARAGAWWRSTCTMCWAGTPGRLAAGWFVHPRDRGRRHGAIFSQGFGRWAVHGCKCPGI